jgi:hypothetical protein
MSVIKTSAEFLFGFCRIDPMCSERIPPLSMCTSNGLTMTKPYPTSIHQSGPSYCTSMEELGSLPHPSFIRTTCGSGLSSWEKILWYLHQITGRPLNINTLQPMRTVGRLTSGFWTLRSSTFALTWTKSSYQETLRGETWRYQLFSGPSSSVCASLMVCT